MGAFDALGVLLGGYGGELNFDDGDFYTRRIQDDPELDAIKMRIAIAIASGREEGLDYKSLGRG